MRTIFPSAVLGRVLALTVFAITAIVCPPINLQATAQIAQSSEGSSPATGEAATSKNTPSTQVDTRRSEGSAVPAGFAIMAGALLVGLAIVLRTTLGNLIAGFVLRAGRAIKVGDLIAVAGREGRVRSITLRATEIEMDDKASFIVPNSTLIASPVLNRTHRGVLARISVDVVAAYSADPEQVRNVLQKVVRDCPHVVPTSAAGTSFNGFGPNGYEFSLSAVVSDVSRAREAETDLRFRIVRALKAAGIEMPHAQHDIHLRDLDKLWGSLGRIAAERAAANAHTEKAPEAASSGAASNRDAVRKK